MNVGKVVVTTTDTTAAAAAATTTITTTIRAAVTSLAALRASLGSLALTATFTALASSLGPLAVTTTSCLDPSEVSVSLLKNIHIVKGGGMAPNQMPDGGRLIMGVGCDACISGYGEAQQSH